MSGYTKLFSTILNSTIWSEDNQTRILWITMLAAANKHGIVEGSIPGLAHIARLSMEDTITSLEKLMGPDEWSRTKDHGGKRVEEIDGGWRILNYAKYRDMLTSEERREYKRNWMRNKRESTMSTGSTSGQSGHIAASEAEAVPQTRGGGEVEPPPRWPKTEDQALAQAEMAGVPRDWALNYLNGCIGRGYRERNGQVIMSWAHSVKAAYGSWQSVQEEKSRQSGNGGRRRESVLDLKTIRDTTLEEAKKLKDRFCSDVAMGSIWTPPEKGTEYSAMIKKVGELNAKIIKAGA